MRSFSIRSLPFRQGFKAVLPLWLATAPFALAYVMAAQKAGLSPLETQLMSLTVYSAAAQIATMQFLSGGGSIVAMLMSALLINLHHVLYGLSLSRHLNLSRLQKVLGAYFLTDSAYGLTMSSNNLSFDFLFGTEMSMFVAWNIFTALGIFVGGLLVLPAWMTLDFIAPLSFFVFLVSSTKTWTEVGIVLLSTFLTLACLALQLGSLTLIVVGMTGALAGTWLTQQRGQSTVLSAQEER